jgi:hypothetical protein
MTKRTVVIQDKSLKQINKRITSRLTLSIRGIMLCTPNSSSIDKRKKFDWKNALIDATITSAITFFGALGGGAVAGINELLTIESAVVAAFSQFFVFLALKRGLIKSAEGS